MAGITASVEDGNLVLRVPMNEKKDGKYPESASGKTNVIASSYGNQTISLEIDGKAVTVGVNAYIKK